MADVNDFRPGDDTNVILRKILSRLGSGITTSDGDGGAGGSVTVTGGSIMVGPSTGSLTNGSGSIATGGVSQEVFAANTSRKYLIIQNISEEDLYINFGGAAVVDSNSLKLLPDGSFVMEGNFVSTEQVTIIGATAGSKFVAKQG